MKKYYKVSWSKEHPISENKRRLNGLVTSCEEIVIEGTIKGGEDREENIICYWICLKNREVIGN